VSTAPAERTNAMTDMVPNLNFRAATIGIIL